MWSRTSTIGSQVTCHLYCGHRLMIPVCPNRVIWPGAGFGVGFGAAVPDCRATRVCNAEIVACCLAARVCSACTVAWVPSSWASAQGLDASTPASTTPTRATDLNRDTDT